jgi:hypothetical protein
MTTSPRTRPIGAPPYYLGRPAALWLAALTPRLAADRREEVSPA